MTGAAASKLRDMGISESAGTLKIPEHCVVNSRAHLRKYAGAEKSEDYDGTFIRNPPAPSEFKKVATLPVDETWSALLLSGVAAHMPHDNSLNPAGDTSYTNYVADQMENGKLAVCGEPQPAQRMRPRRRHHRSNATTPRP